MKHITVRPGGRLNLEIHHIRAQHWIVVKETARVTRDKETFLLSENESTYILLGTKHRLKNPADTQLKMTVVKLGSYLGEDDIVRFEDRHGRSLPPDTNQS